MGFAALIYISRNYDILQQKNRLWQKEEEVRCNFPGQPQAAEGA
jgi:hypothetical protein